MKIALVSPYDFAYPGGVVNHITALEQCFTRMGHTVKVIAPASRAVAVFGDRFIPIGKPRPVPTSGSVVRITLSLHLARTIKRVLEEEQFDIIHFHEPLMPMLCTAMLRFSKTVNVATFHACRGQPAYGTLRPFSTFFFRRRARKLHDKIAVSVTAMKFASKYIPGPYTVIPNGVDLKHFSPDVRKIERFCDRKLNILFTGRLESRKGLIYLLRAYQRIKKEALNTRLIVVGPGTRLRRKYERWVKQNRLPDVVFAGHVPYDELPRYYKTADIFCSPATGQESFGIVLLEAMAMDKPIVASNIEGYASVITHGVDGILVPPKDDRALARTLMTLITHQSLREEMGAQGRLTAMKYRWEDIAHRVFNFYLQAIQQAAEKKESSTVGLLV
ncbi:MAG: glycosyltransferase family 4 protein [Chloroflexota bacterium]